MQGGDSNWHNGMHKGAPASSFSKAEKLRIDMTDAEKKLWEALRMNRLEGYKFRRQHPIHIFIVDFYCHQLSLIIEIDGGYHGSSEQTEKDKERTRLLEFQKLHLIRFTNEEVLSSFENVLNRIRQQIQTLSYK